MVRNSDITYELAGPAQRTQARIQALVSEEEPTACGSLVSAKKYSVPAAAKAMGVGQTKLRELVGAGRIPSIRIEGKILLLERDIEAFLRGHYRGMEVPKPKKERKKGFSLPKEVIESPHLN